MDFKLVTLLLCFVVGILSENEQSCVTPDGEEAICVDLDSCIMLQDFIKNPVGVVNEYLNKSRCDEERRIKICCPSSLNVTVFNNKVLKNETKIQLLDRTNCGYKNKEVMSIYQLPWLGQIMANGWRFCSCSLINARYVLTSASCASDNLFGSVEETGVVILFGDINQETTDKNCSGVIGRADCIFMETFGAEYYIAHPFYNPMTHYASHDIGLIRLNRTVVYKDYIRPICLPPFKTPDLKPEDILYTAGWALYSDKETGKSRLKHKVQSTLLTREQCAQRLNICDSTDIRIKISPTTMCLTQNINTTTTIGLLGETGSPVMNPYYNQWYLEGILSHRKEICWGPLVWTRIESYIRWIEDNMQPWN